MPLDRDPDFLFLNTHKVHLKSFKGGSSCWSGDHTSFDSCKSYTLKARFAENKIVSNYTYPMTIILLDSRPFRVKLFLQSRVYTRQEALCHECWSQCSSWSNIPMTTLLDTHPATGWHQRDSWFCLCHLDADFSSGSDFRKKQAVRCKPRSSDPVLSKWQVDLSCVYPVADPGGPGGPRTPLPPRLFQNHAVFRQLFRKKPLFWAKLWAQAPLLSKLHWAPLPKYWICACNQNV